MMLQGKTIQEAIPHNADGVEVDASLPKIAWLGVFGVLAAFLFGFFLQHFIQTGATSSFWISLISAIILLGFFLLNVFYIKEFWRANSILFLEVVVLLGSLYSFFSGLMLGIGIAVYIMLMLTSHVGRLQLQNMMRIKFWQVAKKTLPLAIIALGLLVSTAYYRSFELTLQNESGFFIDRDSFGQIIFPTAEIIKKLVPDFDITASTEEAIQTIARNTIEKSPEAKLVSEAQREQFIEQEAEGLEAYFTELAGIPLDVTAAVSDTLYKVTAEKFNAATPETQQVVKVSFAVFIFLVIFGLSIPIRWLASVFGLLLYEILLATGFSSTSLEGRSREIILVK